MNINPFNNIISLASVIFNDRIPKKEAEQSKKDESHIKNIFFLNGIGFNSFSPSLFFSSDIS